MNIPLNAINHRILNLETLKIYQDPVNMGLFYNITLPKIAYFLGFCYADGSIRGNNSRVTITILVEDARELKNSFSKFGKYCYYEYDRSHKNRRNIGTFHFNSRGLWQFLFDNDYNEKSTRSADKILSKIPYNLKRFF